MFANSFTALIDTCSLVRVISRNTILSLADAELFRVRWSDDILVELARTIDKLTEAGNGQIQCSRIRRAFPEAIVEDFELYENELKTVDRNDRHVMAAAIKCNAAVLVTDNTKHFPENELQSYQIELKSTDAFIADTIDLDLSRSLAALSRMRKRFQDPNLNAENLVFMFEANGLIESANILQANIESL